MPTASSPTPPQWSLKIVIPGILIALSTSLYPNINPNIQVLAILTFIRALYNRISVIPSSRGFTVRLFWVSIECLLCSALFYSSLNVYYYSEERDAKYTVQLLINCIASAVALCFGVGSVWYLIFPGRSG